RIMPERVHAVIHYQGMKHGFPITRCCDSLYRTVRKYLNFMTKDENRELYWKDEWSSYYNGSAKDLWTAVQWMKKTVKRVSWDPLRIPLFVGENHMNEEQIKESEKPMNGPVYFELYFNGAKYRFSANRCSNCCDTLYPYVREHVDSLVGDTSLELFWKDEWSSYFIGSAKELSIAIEWMKKNTKRDSSKRLRICLFVGDNHVNVTPEKEVERPMDELVYFELKFNDKTRYFSTYFILRFFDRIAEHKTGCIKYISEYRSETLFSTVRKCADSMVGDKTTELIWKGLYIPLSIRVCYCCEIIMTIIQMSGVRTSFGQKIFYRVLSNGRGWIRKYVRGSLCGFVSSLKRKRKIKKRRRTQLMRLSTNRR
ncbi:hypothetical protein PRIPAC_85206, partial [Pristionchus pacificus]